MGINIFTIIGIILVTTIWVVINEVKYHKMKQKNKQLYDDNVAIWDDNVKLSESRKRLLEISEEMAIDSYILLKVALSTTPEKELTELFNKEKKNITLEDILKEDEVSKEMKSKED